LFVEARKLRADNIRALFLREKSAVARKSLLYDVTCIVIGNLLDRYFSRRWVGGKLLQNFGSPPHQDLFDIAIPIGHRWRSSPNTKLVVPTTSFDL
jgi:hypothetical protein